MPNLRPRDLSKDTAADILATGKDQSYLLMSRNGVAIDTAISVEDFEEAVGIANSSYNIRSFGAVGDGITDDTNAILSCFNAAIAANSAVIVPAGTYLCSTWTTFSVAAGEVLRIIGEGSQVSTLKFANVAGPILWLEDAAPTLVLFAVEIDFGGGTQTGNKYGIEFRASAPTSSDVTLDVKHCLLHNTDRIINDSYRPAKSISVMYSEFHTAQSAMRFADKDHQSIVVKDNYIHDLSVPLGSSEQCVGVLTGDNYTLLSEFTGNGGVLISGNRMHDIVHGGADIETHGIVNYYPNAVITDNYIASVAGDGNSGAEALYSKGHNTTISGNVIVDGGDGGEAAIAIKGGSGSTISDNSVIFNANTDATAVGILANAPGSIVSGNIVEVRSGGVAEKGILTSSDGVSILGNSVVGINGASAHGITASQCGNVTIANNTVSGCRSASGTGGAIYLRGLDAKSNYKVSGNRCFDNAPTSGQFAGVYVEPAGTMSDIEIVDNDISGSTKGIYVQFTGGTSLTGVRISRNSVHDLSGVGQVDGIAIADVDDLIIEDNLIDSIDCPTTATSVYAIFIQSAGNRTASQWICRRNTVRNVTAGTGSRRRGISYQTPTAIDFLEMSNNVIDGSYYGLYPASAANITRQNVIGNRFLNVTTPINGTIPTGPLSVYRENTVDGAYSASANNLSEFRNTATGIFTINTFYPSTSIDSSGGAVTATLGSGDYIGQTHTVVMTNATAASTLTVTNHETSDPEVFTFDAVDQTVVLQWTGTEWTTLRDTTSSSQTATGAYTIDTAKQSTSIDSSGGAVTATLGAGSYIGQTHTVVMTDATASSTLSVTNHETSDPEVFTFDAVDEVAVLLWTGTEWITLYATATV